MVRQERKPEASARRNPEEAKINTNAVLADASGFLIRETCNFRERQRGTNLEGITINTNAVLADASGFLSAKCATSKAPPPGKQKDDD
jgi:hypothetical protein